MPADELPKFVAELLGLNAPNCLDAITKVTRYVLSVRNRVSERPDPSATRKRDPEDTPEVLDEPDEAALLCDENLYEPSTPTAPPRSAEQEHEWCAQMCMAPLPKSARALTSS